MNNVAFDSLYNKVKKAEGINLYKRAFIIAILQEKNDLIIETRPNQSFLQA
jgi:hypothetical protein